MDNRAEPPPSHLGIFKLTQGQRGFSFNYENLIVHSVTRDVNKRVEDSGLSIKMGVRGEEHYIFDGERRTVQPGNFLIVNKHQQFDCRLDADEDVEAFCFYLSSGLVADVFQNQVRTERQRLDLPFTDAPAPLFYDRLYHLRENLLGGFLMRLRNELLQTREREPHYWETLYYRLAENMVAFHLESCHGIGRLEASRASTREELYRRLSQVRHYIYEHYREDVDLDQLGRVAMLSKYHLLRSYKQVFRTTPYREVLHLRLERARELLALRHPVAEVAYELGFSDRRAFAKAFKKRFGVSPSAFAAR